MKTDAFFLKYMDVLPSVDGRLFGAPSWAWNDELMDRGLSWVSRSKSVTTCIEVLDGRLTLTISETGDDESVVVFAGYVDLCREIVVCGDVAMPLSVETLAELMGKITEYGGVA